MRIKFKVLERLIKYLSYNCKEKLKLAMKYIVRETFCPGILIFIRYNENSNTRNTIQAQMKFQRSVYVAIGLLC